MYMHVFSCEGMAEGASGDTQGAGACCMRTCQVEGDICGPHLQGCGDGKQADECHAVTVEGVVARACILSLLHDSM